MPTTSTDAFDADVRRHDASLRSAGLCVWVGSEPTFTDRWAQTPEWLHAALGGEKRKRARQLLRHLCRPETSELLLRSEGRRYPGEDDPRWNFGLYQRRDGLPIWHGPPDPLLIEPAQGRAGAPLAHVGHLARFASELADAFAGAGWLVPPIEGNEGKTRTLVVTRTRNDDRPLRFTVTADADESGSALRIELPRLDSVGEFFGVLRCLEKAGLDSELPALIIAGKPPPVDETTALTTVTPDPAVIEVNSAPSTDAAEFLRRSRDIYAAAARTDLAPYRLYFTGAVADSGGGGQITLGGPSPGRSPFWIEPRLLPRLVSYFNRHPALSYLYAHDHLGSGGQSVRADERGHDAFDDLVLELALLARECPVGPERVWRGLAPFLADASGNGHRAEINVEKLWHSEPVDPSRLGLVEFRALRMQHSPERAAALACLLRATVAMLCVAPIEAPLADWGRELHQRFALPFYLEEDLAVVLRDLTDAGFGLGAAIEAELTRDEFRTWGTVDLPGCRLEVRRAAEFWPLLGDATSAEQAGTSRLVDASTARVELRLRPTAVRAVGAADEGPTDWRDWCVDVGALRLPLREERDAHGALLVYGLRYRRYVTANALHPSLGAQAPLRLFLSHPAISGRHCVTLHEWRPDGLAYDGLPRDFDDARERRAARLVCAAETTPEAPTARIEDDPPRLATAGTYCADLRYLG